MFLRKVADFLLARRINAAIIVFLLCLYPTPLVSIAMVIVAFLTLRLGAKAGAFLMLWALLPFVAHAYVLHSLSVVLSAAAGFVLLWLCSLMLRQQFSWDALLYMIVFVAVITVFAVHAFVPDVHAYWVHYMMQMEKQLVLASGESSQATEHVLSRGTTIVSMFMTGLMVSTFMLAMAMKLLFARWWQSLLYQPGGLQAELHGIRFSIWFSICFLVFIAASLMRVHVAIDVLPVFLCAFFFAALSLAHAMIKQKKKALGWFLFLYLLLSLFFPYVAALFVVLALLDSWFDFRKKYSLLV
jgi:hypothetical protein